MYVVLIKICINFFNEWKYKKVKMKSASVIKPRLMLLPDKYLLAYAALTARVWKIVTAKNRNVIQSKHNYRLVTTW